MNDSLANKPIRLALIATYPEMSKTFISMAKDRNVEVEDIYASFEDAVAAAKQMESKVDGIVSRGGTAAMIRQNIKRIPVVTTPITPFDLYLSIQRLVGKHKSFAFSNYERKIFGVQDIAESLDISIIEYAFFTKEDIVKSVRDAKDRGVSVFIGGDVAASEASRIGLIGIEINSGKEALHKSLQEVIDLIRLQRQEKAQAERMHMLLNELSEGIIMTDENQEVVLTNPAARRMLKEGAPDPGQSLCKSFASEIRYEQAVTEGKPIKDYIKAVGDSTLTISHFPVSDEEGLIGVVSTFEDVTKIQQLENSIRKKLYARGFVAKHTFDDILTKNQQMKSIITIARAYAKTNASIMLEGESGTGKELFAQSIHNASKWSNGPFVAVNCSAIPENLLESELFGYEPGAFTGAKKEGKAGLFELAHNGTLFFDEITEMPLHLQPRLLRIIQERQFMRLGGDKTISVNVRIVCATNKNVKKLVADGQFRGDLYYRLSVFELRIPPLRNRKEDILLCLKSFLTKDVLDNPEVIRLLQGLEPMLMRYSWPGNVRQLQSVAERVSLFAESGIDRSESDVLFYSLMTENEKEPPENAMPEARPLPKSDRGLSQMLREFECQIIQNALDRSGGDQTKAAELLQISRATLWRKLNQTEN